jgi:hypothetical protein
MCYHHNLDRPKVGREARWRIIIMGLRIGPYADVLGSGGAVYLDRYA